MPGARGLKEAILDLILAAFGAQNLTFSRVASAIARLRLEVRRFDGRGLEALGRAKNCQSQSPGERRKQGGGGESPQASSIINKQKTDTANKYIYENDN